MPEGPEEKIALKVIGITEASTPDMFALILGEIKGECRKIPIIIGLPEAQSIAVRLSGLRSPRPLCHDIFMTLALSYQIEMVEAIIYKCENAVFYSQVVCKRDDKIIFIDSRTSDAVSLALRFNAPIYTYESVIISAFEKMQEFTRDTINRTKESLKKSEETIKEVFDSLTTPDSLRTLNDEILNKLMESAIEREDYEQASIIRDILNSRR